MSAGLLCRVCEATEVAVFVEIAGAPVLCNLLHETREQALATDRGDIRLAACRECGHVFNAAFDPGRVQYGPGYENSLHFSARFQQHADEMTALLTERHALHGKLVVELGCGRGDFLTSLCRLGGNQGIGFDPSFPGEPGAVDATGDVVIRREAFSEVHAGLGADLVCCRHCLEHVDDPMSFLRALRRGLGDARPAGIFFEVPNVLSTLRDGAIWDLIYEHCGYFSPSSLTRAFQRAGFVDLQAEEAFEGQFLILHGRSGTESPTDARPDEAQVAAVTSLVEQFAALYQQKTVSWRERLEGFVRAGKRVVAWGAGSKGAAFLNVLGASGAIQHVVDINPRKHGHFIAGTGQEIVSPERLRELRPSVVVVMNPNYQAEVAGVLAALGLEVELLRS